MPRSFPLYVVDDEPQVRQVLLDLAAQRRFAGRGFADGEEFLDALPDLGPGCLLLDMRLPGRSGLEVQAELARLGVSFPIIAITGHADIDMAVEAMRMGALDFLEKPFDIEQLFVAVRRGLALLDETPWEPAAPRNEPGAEGFKA